MIMALQYPQVPGSTLEVTFSPLTIPYVYLCNFMSLSFINPIGNIAKFMLNNITTRMSLIHIFTPLPDLDLSLGRSVHIFSMVVVYPPYVHLPSISS